MPVEKLKIGTRIDVGRSRLLEPRCNYRVPSVRRMRLSRLRRLEAERPHLKELYKQGRKLGRLGGTNAFSVSINGGSAAQISFKVLVGVWSTVGHVLCTPRATVPRFDRKSFSYP